MRAAPPTREQFSPHIPALHLLINLGWQFLTTEDALKLRGSTREIILKQRLIEVLQTRRFEYKGEFHPLSPGGIDQIVRQAQTLSLAEGLLPANERLYRLLTLGVTVTEFMPDGKKHQPTIALIDWQDPASNRWDATEALEVLSANGTHVRVPDVVGYVNGLPLVVIEAKRPGVGQDDRAMVEESIGQQLRNQRHDEIPQLFAYAQVLLAVCGSEARYGTTHTALKFWARWREEAFGDAQLADWKNYKVPEGRARGVAVVESFDTFVAQVVELSMTTDGPKVHKVWCAVDCGVAVNPDIIRAQMEGGIGFGLGHILYAEQALDNGAPVSGNFDTYRSLRINEMPEIEVTIVKSEEKPTGVGEPGVPPLGPAVANAMAKLGIGRPRQLPIVPGASA
jgi:hypothetical protein